MRIWAYFVLTPMIPLTRRSNAVHESGAPGRRPTLLDVEVTVVVLSAGRSPYLRRVLDGAARCVTAPDRLLVVWSGRAVCPRNVLPPGVRLLCVPPTSFDHGGTRQVAVEHSDSAIVAFLSDDAEPVDTGWLHALLAPFGDPSVGVVYGRHVPKPEAPLAERVFRLTRYPTHSLELSPGGDGAPVTFPMSDANAAYRVSALASVGGFPQPCAFAEDYLVTQRLLRAGWRVVYASAAAVWHSHDVGWRNVSARAAKVSAASSRSVGLRGRDWLRTARHGVVFLLRMLPIAWREGRLRGLLSVGWVMSARVFGFLFGRTATTHRLSACAGSMFRNQVP